MGAQIAISGKSSPPSINPQKKEKQWIRNAPDEIPFIDAKGAANSSSEETDAVEAFL